MTGLVPGFVGENANGILEWWMRQILSRIERAGFTTQLIDLMQPGWMDDLSEALKTRPTFAFGFQGIGAAIRQKNVCLWDNRATLTPSNTR